MKAERRLPLLIRLPDQDGAREVDQPASHVDIAPTVLSLLGVPDANEVMLGRDLLSDDPPLVVFRDGSFIADDRAAIASDSDSQPECVEPSSGAQLPCGPLEHARREARRHMEVSDLLIRGNLIRALRRPSQPAISPPGSTLRPVQIICHRGNSAEAPENTLASIEAAFSLGCDVVEIDVRLSRDGVAVIIHDDTVDRTTNGTGNVADLTLAELKALDAGSWRGSRFSGERVPTLEEALLAARGEGPLLLDVPVAGMGVVIAEAFRSLGLPFSAARIATWNDKQRRDIATHMPGAAIFQADGPPKIWNAGYFSTRRTAGVHAFDIGQWPPGFVQQARAADMPVWVWTINDPQTMRDVIREGVDGFETDVPRTAIAIARELGGKP